MGAVSGDEPDREPNPETRLESSPEPGPEPNPETSPETSPEPSPEPSLAEQREQLAAVLEVFDARVVAMANDADYADPEFAAALGDLRAHIDDAKAMTSEADDDEFLDRLEGVTDNLKRSFARLKERL